MLDGDRYLLVVTKNKSTVVLECPNRSSMISLKSEAEARGAVCKRILINEFYPDYRGYRYFDLRNTLTRKTFNMVEIIQILDAPLEKHGDAEDLFGGNIFH